MGKKRSLNGCVVDVLHRLFSTFRSMKSEPRHCWTLSMFYKTVVTVAEQYSIKIVQLIFEIQRSVLGNFSPVTGQEYTGFD